MSTKILRILNRLNIGGPSYNVAYLSKYISDTYDTRILTGIKEPYEGSAEYMLDNLDLTYQYVPNMYRSIYISNDYRAYLYIKSQIETYKPDIVHTHAAKAGILGRLAAYYSKNRPRAIVHTYHGNVFDGYFSPLKTKLIIAIERYLCKLSDAIIAISEQQKNDLVNKYKIAPAYKVHVIKLGFDLDKFNTGNQEKRQNFREFYNIKDDEVVITITGRLTSIKNHSFFIEAIKLLKKKNLKPKFKVFVVGDGELLEALILQVNLAGFSTCIPNDTNYDADVVFTSWRKDIDVVNAGSDIIALTSLNEGTPVSIIEALASNKAVISTNVGGVKDIIEDEYSGLLSSMDTQVFADKMGELIINKALRDKLSNNGKKIVLQKYSYTNLVQSTQKLYEFLLN
jgi:glycosyltransferase involved in cell wall biosynthesis